MVGNLFSLDYSRVVRQDIYAQGKLREIHKHMQESGYKANRRKLVTRVGECDCGLSGTCWAGQIVSVSVSIDHAR